MRLIYISHLHPPPGHDLENLGGTQTVSLQLLAALKQRSELSVYPLLLETPHKGHVWRVILFLVQLYRQLPALVQREQADIILFASMVTASLAWLRRDQIPIPMVTLNHGQDVTLPFAPYQWLVPRIFKNLDGVISVSQATRLASLERGLDATKSFVLPNGLPIHPTRLYDKALSRQRLEKVLGIDLQNARLLLSVGRQVKRKGHAWFIQAVLPLLQGEWVYLLIGEGPESQHIQQAAQASPDSERIILTGVVSRELLQQAYDASDLLIMPNIPVEGDMEGFGVVMLEANEARTPAIASDLEGIKDVIVNGMNGYRVEPLNAHAFAATINRLGDPALAELSHSAYQYVVQTFSWETIGADYIRILKQIRDASSS